MELGTCVAQHKQLDYVRKGGEYASKAVQRNR